MLSSFDVLRLAIRKSPLRVAAEILVSCIAAPNSCAHLFEALAAEVALDPGFFAPW